MSYPSPHPTQSINRRWLPLALIATTATLQTVLAGSPPEDDIFYMAAGALFFALVATCSIVARAAIRPLLISAAATMMLVGMRFDALPGKIGVAIICITCAILAARAQIKAHRTQKQPLST